MAETPSKPRPFPALSRPDRLVVLLVAVALFVVLDGPVWRHLFDWDRAIGWSYAAVPVLVGLALVLRRRFSWIAWFLHTLELTFLKFAVTAGILLVLLERANPQGPPPVVPMPPTKSAAPAARLPPPPPLAARGRLDARVAGAPPGTLVFISSGLAGFDWQPPAEPLQLTNDGHGFEPELSAAEVGGTLTAVSTDHRLHTLLMTQSGNAWRVNAPVLASGAPTPINPGAVTGVVDLTCAVHGAAEHPSRLVLLGHPFFRRVGPDATLAFDSVPTGEMTLTALAPDGRTADMKATVRAGETAHVEWSLPAAPGPR